MSDPKPVEEIDAEVPESLQDEYGKVKIGLAAGIGATVVGVTVGVAFGYIKADNAVAAALVPIFTYMAGIATSFFFKKK